MSRKVMYVEVEGLHAALIKARHPHLAAAPLIFVRGKEVVDLCPLAARQGGRRGMPLQHARHLIGGGLEIDMRSTDVTTEGKPLARWGAEVSPRVEVEDESRIFLQLASNDSPRKIFDSLLQELLGQCGHRFLAAAAKNKLVAKIAVMLLREENPGSVFPASSVASLLRDGGSRLVVVKRGQEAEFLRSVPVSFLWPFPQVVLERLRRLGIRRIGQLDEVPSALLRRHFDLYGLQLRRCVQGDYPQQVADDYPPLHVRWERDINFNSSIRAEKLLNEAAGYLAEGLAADGLSAGMLQVRLITDAGKRVRERRALTRPASGQRRIFSILLSMFSKRKPKGLLSEGSGSLWMQVEASGLQRSSTRQMNIFSQKQRRNTREAVGEIARKLQQKHSPEVIFWGRGSSVSRKEKMFAFWDPLRRAEERVGI